MGKPGKVYVLQHCYESESHEDTKLIGVYSSEEQAKMASERLKIQAGFRDYPNSFIVDEYELNDDHWIEGFHIQW